MGNGIFTATPYGHAATLAIKFAPRTSFFGQDLGFAENSWPHENLIDPIFVPNLFNPE